MLKNLFKIQSILRDFCRQLLYLLFFNLITSVSSSYIIDTPPYFQIYLYVRFLEFPKPRRSDRETDRIQSGDPDRQTRCYPINSSIPYSNWSEFLVDRRDRIAVCHQCNINYPPAVSRSISPSLSLSSN